MHQRVSMPAAAAALIAAIWAGPVAAQPTTEEAVAEIAADDASWSVTVTPRFQPIFFLPDSKADGLEVLISAGASVAVRSPDGGFGVTATLLYGKGSGTYDFSDAGRSGTFDYRGKRREFALLGELTPSETNVTFLGGYHYFSATAHEMLINGGADSEANDFNFSIHAAEIGLRLASRLGTGSKHSVSAQFSGGVGLGHYKADENRLVGGVARTRQRDDGGFGYIGDVALGYNYFLTDRMTIGGRGRGYLFYVQSDGSYPIFAVTPEINMSFRF